MVEKKRKPGRRRRLLLLSMKLLYPIIVKPLSAKKTAGEQSSACDPPNLLSHSLSLSPYTREMKGGRHIYTAPPKTDLDREKKNNNTTHRSLFLPHSLVIPSHANRGASYRAIYILPQYRIKISSGRYASPPLPRVLAHCDTRYPFFLSCYRLEGDGYITREREGL